MISADHHFDSRRGFVWIKYKQSLTVFLLSMLISQSMYFFKYNVSITLTAFFIHAQLYFFTWCKKKPVKVIDTLLLTKCILCEISVDNKKGYVAVVYRSPSKITMNWIFF